MLCASLTHESITILPIVNYSLVKKYDKLSTEIDKTKNEERAVLEIKPTFNPLYLMRNLPRFIKS